MPINFNIHSGPVIGTKLSSGDTRLDASADPYAGTTASNGKPIWSEDQAADNLNRDGDYWGDNDYGNPENGVLTYGYWTRDALISPESDYVAEDGSTSFYEAYYARLGYFEAFNPQQQAMAAANVQLWDDLIPITFELEENVHEADITFGFTPMSPAAGAYAYYPFGDVYDPIYEAFYNIEEIGRLGGDVWANWLYQEDFTDQGPGDYGWFAITHELGHSLGLAHGGEYNASDDNDGDREPDPITYSGDAYFFQDSHQYTIMSYFSSRNTGAAWVEWTDQGGVFKYAATPMVHDVLAVQNTYGGDMTTRAGNTVYGFNSTAGNIVFDAAATNLLVATVWDADGNDTFDFSGYDTNSIIDINPGGFSSVGHGITAEAKAYYAAQGIDTQEELDAFFANNNLGPDGRPTDNFAIAYSAVIENAIGGDGDDTIIGNGADNHLVGGNGDDTISGGLGIDLLDGGNGKDTLSGGDGPDTLLGGNGTDTLNGGAGNDVLNGGNGKDLYVFAHAGTDTIVKHEAKEKIDLSAFSNVDSSDVTITANSVFVELGANDLTILYSGSKVTMDDIIFAPPAGI